MTATNEGAGVASSRLPQNIRDVTTPEGVPLRFELASRSERATALIIDLVILLAVVIVLALLVIFVVGAGSGSGWGLAIALLVFFALRNFYFTFFELRWHGMTPGKRALQMRVIDRHGGRLRPDSVFARNLMREVELFLPLSLVASANTVGAGNWAIFFALVWASLFALMPLFNKDVMRAGDIVGGTWVIKAPRSRLLPDMAQAAVAGAQADSQMADYVFTRDQLKVYGIYELQTLEAVLRQDGPTAHETQAAVCKRIRRKIGWQDADEQIVPKRFLEAFYAALRAHLENRMLFGERRESKHDRTK